MQSSESTEMYLETIYVLQQRQQVVRAVDIATEMGYSKPTISEWMNKLRREGYIDPARGRNIVLTDKGMRYAEKIYERHTILTAVLEHIGVSPEVASEDACRVEHYISDETFDAVKGYLARYNKAQ